MTSKVQTHCIAVALKSGNHKLACKLALFATIQNIGTGSVYLPNAYDLVSADVTPKQWAGYLSALARDGEYKPTDGEFWGCVAAAGTAVSDVA